MNDALIGEFTGDIRRDAPAIASGEVVIEAAPEEVWEVLTDFRGWPSWNPDIGRVEAGDCLERGTVFRWRAGPGWITSTLQLIDAPHRIAWTGRTSGIDAIHIFKLTDRAGSTVVKSEESWEGFIVRLFRRRLASTLKRSIESGLGFLKQRVEQGVGDAD
jgi:hypothetical protein